MSRFPIRLGRRLELIGKVEKEDLDRISQIQKELNVELGIRALLEGYLTLDTFMVIYARQRQEIKTFREVALQGRFLTTEQLEELDRLDGRKHVRIGGLLTAAGLVTEEDIQMALEYDHFLGVE